VTMQLCDSRPVSPHGSSKPSSIALLGIQHLCSQDSHRARAVDNFLSFGAARAPQELPGYFPCTLFPLERIRYQARADRKTPYRTEGVHQ